MTFIEKKCFIRTFALILAVYSMFPYKNSVSLRFLDTCSLKRFISCNRDNSVQAVISIGNKGSLWHHHGLKAFLR